MGSSGMMDGSDLYTCNVRITIHARSSGLGTGMTYMRKEGVRLALAGGSIRLIIMMKTERCGKSVR
jgi:hypothetical protein